MKAINAYKKASVATGDRMSILVALYDGFISKTQAARQAYDDGARARAGECSSKALAIVQELSASLDHGPDPEFAERLASIYEYVESQLMKASLENDGSHLDDVLALMSDLRDAWAEGARQLRGANG